jgi:Tfp pilus assembly protein PilZ
MSAEEQQNLLYQLEKGRPKEKRQSPRKNVSVPVEYATPQGTYQDFIKNVSAGGVFIETKEALEVGHEIVMVFPLFSFEDPVKVNGKIAWKGPQGIGVKFERTLRDFLENDKSKKLLKLTPKHS